MTTVLAALDSSPAARGVLEVALSFGELLGAEVEAVHVRDGDVDTPTWLAARGDVPLHVLEGPVGPALLEVIAEDRVVAAVFGARGTPGGRRPAGGTALHILERCTKPVVVVPPTERAAERRPMKRVLLPLEGSPESSRPIIDCLCPLIDEGAELIVVHVFTPATLPRALDRPGRDLTLWAEEFTARFCPDASRVELRTGPVEAAVASVAAEADVDLVALSWSQDISAGHAAVVHDLIERSPLPLLLLPVSASPDSGPTPSAGDVRP